MVGSAFAPIGNLGGMNGTMGLGNLSYGRVTPSNVYNTNVPLSEALSTMGSSSLRGSIYDSSVPLSQGFYGTKAVPNVLGNGGYSTRFPSYVNTATTAPRFQSSLGIDWNGMGNANANANTSAGAGTNAKGSGWGNMLGNAQAIAGLVGGLMDIYTGFGAYKQNKKNMQLQREAMQYNLDRTRSENKRLDKQRADVTKSWNNGQVM